MAGAVRQPIDIASLSSYLGKNVHEIQLPISVKQVLSSADFASTGSQLTYPAVWLWAIQSYLPAYRSRWGEICPKEKTSWQIAFKDSTSS